MDLFEPVREFERRMADFTGFKYGVAVESCSAALFLCLRYRKVGGTEIMIPKNTYPSVAASIVHCGARVLFNDYTWQETLGFYELMPTNIFDSAIYMAKGMRKDFLPESMVCLSFHHKKMLPIGRGGMVLTDDEKAVEWLKSARHDGRHDKVDLKDDIISICGWNMLMTPEQASRGLALMGNLRDVNQCAYQAYPDLSKMPAFMNQKTCGDW
jgi:dTDP-4-amino-4,6-dideoxygalactose transaminase